MRNFKPDEYKLFTQICQMSQKQLMKVLPETLKRAKYKNIIEANEYIAAEGDIPICLVAHLDTVFSFPPYEIYYDREQNVIWSPDGLGADDRAGVFGILQIIKSGLRPHVIFTTDEETGGLGALAAAINGLPFEDVRYFIELDRQGYKDCVFYKCNNKEFQTYIESFGFKTEKGSFSDISILCPEFKIAGVNLSIGYYYEHSYSELFNVNHFFTTINKVKRMLTVEVYPKQYEYVSANPSEFEFYKYWMQKRELKTCVCCQNQYEEDEMLKVSTDAGELYYCFDCLQNNVDWCAECHQPYEIDGVSKICPDCRKEFKF